MCNEILITRLHDIALSEEQTSEEAAHIAECRFCCRMVTRLREELSHPSKELIEEFDAGLIEENTRRHRLLSWHLGVCRRCRG